MSLTLFNTVCTTVSHLPKPITRKHLQLYHLKSESQQKLK